MAFDASDLSSQEQYVVERTRDGEIADFSAAAGPDGAKPALRAAFLRKLLLQLEPGWPVRMPGVRIRGARIDGALDLSDCAELPALELAGCEIAERIDLRHTRIARLSFESSALTKLDGLGLHVRGVFNLSGIRAAAADGLCWIDARALTVDGNVELSESRLAAPTAREEGVAQHLQNLALRLSDARIAGSLHMARLQAQGGVSIGSAHVDGDVMLSHAVLEAGEGKAFRARAAQISGALVLRDAKVAGEVDLRSASIGSNFEIVQAEVTHAAPRGGDIKSEYDVAISATNVRVGGAALFQGANIKGEIFLADARIDGYLAFGGGRFMNGGGWAIRAPNVRIGGNLTLKLADDDTAPHGKKTVIQGGAKFDRAQIDGAVAWLNLELRGAGPDGAKGPLLSFADACIKGSLQARNLTAQEDARIDLAGARCGALDDDLKTGWGVEKAALDLEGFSYARLDGGGKDDRWRARLGWLRKSRRNGFSPQPYAVLADVYARAGWREDARRVLLAQHDLRALHSRAGPLTRALSSAFGLVCGYGFAP
ncbi:MAG TPA: hypothetical protein VG943_01140, partial [Caulobacterales bacterium]|nr:hypothetical protein [Caulobacterales bacterium]